MIPTVILKLAFNDLMKKSKGLHFPVLFVNVLFFEELLISKKQNWIVCSDDM